MKRLALVLAVSLIVGLTTAKVSFADSEQATGNSNPGIIPGESLENAQAAQKSLDTWKGNAETVKTTQQAINGTTETPPVEEESKTEPVFGTDTNGDGADDVFHYGDGHIEQDSDFDGHIDTFFTFDDNGGKEKEVHILSDGTVVTEEDLFGDDKYDKQTIEYSDGSKIIKYDLNDDGAFSTYVDGNDHKIHDMLGDEEEDDITIIFQHEGR